MLLYICILVINVIYNRYEHFHNGLQVAFVKKSDHPINIFF